MRNAVLILICLALAPFCRARTITVDDDGPADFNNIQAGINDANDGDTVEIQPGTYTGPGNRDIDFAGKAITVRSTDPNDPNIVTATIIDCNGTEANPHRGFNFVSGEDPNSVLAGVTITNGFGPAGPDRDSHGGAILCNASSPTITECVLRNNSVLTSGGAVCAIDASPTFTQCTFSNNVASYGDSYGGFGGGVNCRAGNARIIGCAFTGNRAREGGGAIFEGGGASSIVADCTFNDNSVEKRRGGAICTYGGMLLTNSTFSRNSGVTSGGAVDGGAVYCYGYNSATITGCTFVANWAWQGGAIYCDHDNTLISNCQILGNSATHESPDFERGGGGIACDYSSAVIRNCIIAENSAQYGGGIFLDFTHNQLEHCTIANNLAVIGGDGVYCAGDSRPKFTPHITNSIIWGNSGSAGPDISSTVPIISYSNIEGGYPGTENADIDPCLVNPSAGDYHLRGESSCRDTGDPLYFNTTSGHTDIDGEPRVMGPRTDRGADEFTDEVLEMPIVGLSSTQFVFKAVESGPDPEPQILTVRNIGLGTLRWQIHNDCSWLGSDPSAGQCAGDPNHVSLSIDISTLSWGSYQCELIAEPETSANGPQTIIVNLHIRRQTPLLVPAEYGSIQQAINAAAWGDTIIVSPGTYRENIHFLGKNLTLTSVDPYNPNAVADTVIQGNGTASVVAFAGTEDTPCHLVGFTITSGHGTEPGYGGGIQGNGTTANINNCIIKQNSAYRRGGGLFDCDGPITSCTITENSVSSPASTEGAGLHSCDGPITNCTISYNTSGTPSHSGFGGGLYNCQGPITGCKILGNSAGGSGGGLYDCDGLITDCLIHANIAHHQLFQSRGGGLYRCDGNIAGCSITSNIAWESGGGFYQCRGPIADCVISANKAMDYDGGGLTACASITNCLVINNSAGSNGGGLGDCSDVTNCVIAHNTAVNGGGVFNPRKLTNCTLTTNEAAEKGGGIYLQGHASVANCIIWDDSASAGNEICLDPYVICGRGGCGEVPSSMDVTFTNAKGGLAAVSATDCIVNWGEGNIDADPCFADPNANDVHLKSQAGRYDPNSGSWVLDDVTSPCIDAGDPMSPIGLEPFPNGGIVNMGAYGGTDEASKSYFGEPVCEVIVAGDINGDCIVDFRDFLFVGLHWMEDNN